MVDVRWIGNNGTVVKSSSVYYKNSDGSYNITRRMEVVYTAPRLLSCEVFGPAIKGELIHIGLETEQGNHELVMKGK